MEKPLGLKAPVTAEVNLGGNEWSNRKAPCQQSFGRGFEMEEPLEKEFCLNSRRGFVKGIFGGCAAALLSGVVVPSAFAAPAGPPRPGSDAKLAEWSKQRFLFHWNCSRAVLEALGPRYGLDYHLAVKIACAFAAGEWKGKTCGSFTAGYMAIGLAHGAIPKKEDHYDVKPVHERLVRFDRAMLAAFGTLDCSALLGTDMGTPQGIKEAAAKGMFTKVCPRTVVAAVTEILKINV